MEIDSVSFWRHGGHFSPASFESLTFGPGRDLGPAGFELVAMLGTQVDRVAVATVSINGLDAGMREWLEKDRGWLPHITALAASDALRDALPEVMASSQVNAKTFERMHPLQLAGSLAQQVYDGGAYTPLAQCSASHAARLADAVVHEIIADRYEQFHVSHSDEPWSDWFLEDSWLASWIITDTTDGHTVMLCCSDTD